MGKAVFRKPFFLKSVFSMGKGFLLPCFHSFLVLLYLVNDPLVDKVVFRRHNYSSNR